MVYEYYAVDRGPAGTYFSSMWFQFLEATGGDPAKSNLFYGFPNVPWRPPNLVRIAVDNAVHVIADPDQRQISPAANDLQITADFVARHCVGVDDRPNFLRDVPAGQRARQHVRPRHAPRVGRPGPRERVAVLRRLGVQAHAADRSRAQSARADRASRSTTSRSFGSRARTS